MKRIRYNKKTQEYTLKEKNEDGEVNNEILPPKYSPEDKYGKYRRMAKKQQE